MRRRLFRAILLASLILASVIAWRDTMTVTLTTAEVPVSGLTRPVTILHAADLHGASFGEGQSDIASLLDGSHYDAAVINGDHIPTFESAPTPALELLSVLREHADVVFVTRGNHDTSAAIDALVANGAVAVEPGVRAVAFATDACTLVAVPAPSHSDIPADTALVLALGHYPLTAETIDAQADGHQAPTLFLFGHTHGGQIRLPIVGALWAPGEMDFSGVASRRNSRQNLFPELRGRTLAGLQGSGDVYTHTSGGLGTQGIRLRLLAPAEMTVITLVPTP